MVARVDEYFLYTRKETMGEGGKGGMAGGRGGIDADEKSAMGRRVRAL